MKVVTEKNLLRSDGEDSMPFGRGIFIEATCTGYIGYPFEKTASEEMRELLSNRLFANVCLM